MTLMGAAKMHADEIEMNVALMHKLLAGQFPQWMDLPISRVMSYGTDNYIYRLGDQLAARLPRHPGWAVDQVKLEAKWLPTLAPHLPLAVPVLTRGRRPAVVNIASMCGRRGMPAWCRWNGTVGLCSAAFVRARRPAGRW